MDVYFLFFLKKQLTFVVVVFLHVAEYLGLPFVPPYFGGSMESFKEAGVNFAVAGATALDAAFLQEKGLAKLVTNISLVVQLGLFKELLPSLCSTPSGRPAISNYG
jgi:hypothetical protein